MTFIFLLSFLFIAAHQFHILNIQSEDRLMSWRRTDILLVDWAFYDYKQGEFDLNAVETALYGFPINTTGMYFLMHPWRNIIKSSINGENMAAILKWIS